MAVRAAGRRGAGAPPAEARPMNGCARCRPSWGWGPAGRGAAYEWLCALQADRCARQQRRRGTRRRDPRSDGRRLAKGAPAEVHGLRPVHQGGDPAHAAPGRRPDGQQRGQRRRQAHRHRALAKRGERRRPGDDGGAGRAVRPPEHPRERDQPRARGHRAVGPAHQRNRADAQDQRRRGPAAGRAQHSARAHLHAGGSRERGRVRRLAAGQLHERGDHHARRRPAEGTARLTSVIVDVHVHYVSPGAFDAARRQPDTYGVRLLPGDGVRLQIGDEPPTRPLLPARYTLDRHTKVLAEQGIDPAEFGPLMDVAAYSLPMAQGAAWSRLQNEALAGALREAPGVHRGLATVPLQEPAAAAAELRFAVRELGLRGAMVDPNALGRPLGDGAFDPFWKAAADLAAPIVLHPFLLEAVERFGRHYLHNLVGYPFETTLAAASLILGGTLDRFPGLSVVLVHGGGFLPYHIGRFDRAHETRPEARVDDAGLPSRYLRRFFYDTLVQRPEALRYLVQLVGHDRVMLGSDHPFWMGDPDPLRVVREAGLDPATEAAIFGENAAQIFHLRP